MIIKHPIPQYRTVLPDVVLSYREFCNEYRDGNEPSKLIPKHMSKPICCRAGMKLRVFHGKG